VSAAATVAFTISYGAIGGIPVYHWDITAGALPPGLALDPFTGTVAGTPTTSGDFQFTLRVRDYHEGSVGVTRPTAILVAPPPPVRLAVSLLGQGAGSQLQLLLYGTAGQEQILQVSTNLLDWTAVATNSLATNLFQFLDQNPLPFAPRFYRAVTVL
jgi:hypothetical protein